MVPEGFKNSAIGHLTDLIFADHMSCARYQKGLSPLFSKIVLFEKTNQNGLTHIVGLRHPRIYVKNRRKHVVQNIEKGLSPNFFISTFILTFII